MKKWVAAVAVVFALAGISLAQQQTPGGAELQAGLEALKQKKWDSAISSLEKAIQANSDLFASHYYLGIAYQSKRNYQKAGENFAKFLDRVGDNPEAAEQIAYATRQAGLNFARTRSAGKAIPYLEKAVAAKPNDKESHFFLGTVLLRNNQPSKAEEHFSKVKQLDPSLAEPHYYSGRIAFDREEWGSVKPNLEKFLELKPTSPLAPDAHFMLGSLAARQAEGSADAPTQQESAKSHLNQFLEMKPNSPQSPQAHYILGSLAAQSEDTEAARVHFQKYLELEPQGAQADEVKKFLAELSEGEEEGG